MKENFQTSVVERLTQSFLQTKHLKYPLLRDLIIESTFQNGKFHCQVCQGN